MSTTSAQSVITELDGKVSVKWENDGVFHRFWLPVKATFSDLMLMVKNIDPDFDDYLAYKDDEGDLICLGSTAELREFLRITTVHDVLCVIATKPKDPAKKSPPAKPADRVITFPKILPRVAPKVHHRGITCSSCRFPVLGIRYQCIDCDVYNLCESCEKTGIHEDHSMVRIVTEQSPKPSYVHLSRVGAFCDSGPKERGVQTDDESIVDDVADAERIDSTEVQKTDDLALIEIPDQSSGVFPVHNDETMSQMASSTVTLESAQDELLRSIIETTRGSISSAFQILNLDVTKPPPPPSVVSEDVKSIPSEARNPEFFADGDDNKSEMSDSIVLVENPEDELHRSMSGSTREISNTYEILNLDITKSTPSVITTEEVLDTSVQELLAAGDRNNASMSSAASNRTFTIVSSPEGTSADSSFSIPSSAASLSSGSSVHSDFDILSNPGDQYED